MLSLIPFDQGLHEPPSLYVSRNNNIYIYNYSNKKTILIQPPPLSHSLGTFFASSRFCAARSLISE